MVIFHSYVTLPEGIPWYTSKIHQIYMGHLKKGKKKRLNPMICLLQGLSMAFNQSWIQLGSQPKGRACLCHQSETYSGCPHADSNIPALMTSAPARCWEVWVLMSYSISKIFKMAIRCYSVFVPANETANLYSWVATLKYLQILSKMQFLQLKIAK